MSLRVITKQSRLPRRYFPRNDKTTAPGAIRAFMFWGVRGASLRLEPKLCVETYRRPRPKEIVLWPVSPVTWATV
jgi:hypothetical protein